MVVRQGDLFWLELEEPEGSEPGFRRPVLVVQNNLYNASRIRTTVVCALTTTLRRAQDPDNVLLEPNEGDLPKQSVVIVSQIDTVDRSQLAEYIGKLNPSRVRHILQRMLCVFNPGEADEKEE